MTAFMRKLFKNFSRRYFDESLDLHIQVFNLLAFAGVAAGIIIAGVSALQKAGAASVGLNLLASVLAIILLRITGTRISYRAASWFIIITVFMLLFPLLFFAIGGYRSGMPGFFIFAIVFTAMLLEKRERFAAILPEFIIYIGCCIAAYFYPHLVTQFESEAYYVSDVITGILVSGGLILLVVLLSIRMYRTRVVQIKELNRELEARNEALELYSKMKSDFLVTVAHEISPPLTAIVLSSTDTMELLEESPVNMGEIIENHKRIEQKVLLIDRIVTDLMDTAAIETGRLSLSRQPVRLSELLRAACGAGMKQLDTNGNRIVYDFEEKLPLIWADPGRMEQVMLNLLSNAVRHTKGGTITVRLTRAEQRQTVSVSDTGEGMEPEIAAGALKEYVTSSGESWRHGYGLYICRQIILSHDGEIWIDSEKGRGTTVSFTLKEENND